MRLSDLDWFEVPRVPVLWWSVQMRVVAVRDHVYTAIGFVRGKPYLEIDGGPSQPLILGVTGLPCNARIIEPETHYSVEFDGSADYPVENGAMRLPEDGLTWSARATP